ncbi:MAG: hypothetical protein V1882_08460 [Candidatus Omnitrophota bacterium]
MIIKTSPYNRKCKHLKCTNILSIYNHEAYCYVHLSQGFKEGREREAAERGMACALDSPFQAKYTRNK